MHTFTSPGWVYAARENETPLVKIGHTKNPNVGARLISLRFQFHVPFTLVGAIWIFDGVCYAERALHRKLEAERIEGEFFYLPMNQSLFAALVEAILPEVCERLQAEEALRQRHILRYEKRARAQAKL